MNTGKPKDFFYLRVLLLVILPLCLTVVSMAQNSKKKKDIFAQENLVAWCIVPFDNQHRTPGQRIGMLKQLKFSQYAYDWRHQHLESFAEEIRLARENNIRIEAVWMWIDKSVDSPGKLSEDNETVLSIIKESGLKARLWVGFNHNFFDDDDDATKVARGVEMIKYLREHTKNLVTGIGLYNHGDWFGEPENQIKILKEINDPGVGLIYNFHHGHKQIDSFPSLLTKMSPWLWTVNIDGMKKEGPQILPVGSGDQEKGMLKVLKKSGFSGTIGILGHIEDEDVEVVLQRNLNGLRKIEKEL